MKDIFEKDLSGEMVSPDEPGYDALIDDIFRTMETAQELSTVSIRDQKPRSQNRLRCHSRSRERSNKKC